MFWNLSFAGQENSSLPSSKEKTTSPTEPAQPHSENMTLPSAYKCYHKKNFSAPAEFIHLSWLYDFGTFFHIPSNKSCLLHFFSCVATFIQLKYFPVIILCHRYVSDFKEIVRLLYLQFFLPYPVLVQQLVFPVSIFFPILYRKFL